VAPQSGVTSTARLNNYLFPSPLAPSLIRWRNGVCHFLASGGIVGKKYQGVSPNNGLFVNDVSIGVKIGI